MVETRPDSRNGKRRPICQDRPAYLQPNPMTTNGHRYPAKWCRYLSTLTKSRQGENEMVVGSQPKVNHDGFIEAYPTTLRSLGAYRRTDVILSHLARHYGRTLSMRSDRNGAHLR